MKVAQSWLSLCDPMNYTVRGILQARTLEWVAFLSLLQGIFLTQGSNPCLPHYRSIVYQLSHQGSPGILEWVASPFSSGSSLPRNQTGVSCIAGDSLPAEPPGRPLHGMHPNKEGAPEPFYPGFVEEYKVMGK